MMLIDLTDRRFGRWLVERRARSNRTTSTKWFCRCICGTTKAVDGVALRSGISKSCGCLSHELLSARSTTHGHTRGGYGTREYRTWVGMLQRCNNPNATDFKLYGGRGVKVCERWHTFENFFADMGKRPTKKSLDRINPYGNYTPDNCRWATAREQVQNRRSRSPDMHPAGRA